MKILRMCSIFIFVLSCNQPGPNLIQGYVEGEFLYIAAPVAGVLRELNVAKGDSVEVTAKLFSLDPSPERESLDEAAAAFRQARAAVDDAKKGLRQPELDALQAQLKQAKAGFVLAEEEFRRQENLSRLPGVTSKQDFERARAARNQSRERVSQLESEIVAAQLGSRSDHIAALEAAAGSREAALRRAEWHLSQKTQRAPQAGLVFDTLFHEGEWVPSGRPLVALLPPERIKVRAFVAEPLVGAIRNAQPVTVLVDGARQPIAGIVSFISPKPEYTPPVIYSRENRSKLSFMIEISFPSEVSRQLHPGQPVDVRLG